MSEMKKTIRCRNCGKMNHYLSECKDPITSCGLICLKINDKKIHETFITNLKGLDQSHINQFNNKYNKNLNKMNKYMENISFLMIQRKQSYSFIEIIYSKFNFEDKNYVNKIVRGLSENEMSIIKNKDFDYILENEFNDTNYNKHVNYVTNKERFKDIKEYINEKKMVSKYKELEWGFPKGRRLINERNLDCAIREFSEETEINKENINLIDTILPLREIFTGNNNLMYKYIYHVAYLNDTENIYVSKNNDEVNDISWMTIKDIKTNLRDYHVEKKKMIIELYKYIINVLEIKDI